MHKNVKIRDAIIEIGTKNGFRQARTNLYRCYGDGLLQVISIPTSRAKSIDPYPDREIYIGLFSLYSDLFWLPSSAVKVLQYDLHLSINAKELLYKCSLHRTSDVEILDVLEKILLLFLKLDTHDRFVSFFEEMECKNQFSMREKRGLWISPYIISGRKKQAIDCIDAIEKQNWDAYHHNSINPHYDREKKRRSIEERLFPLIALRDAIVANDQDIITSYLQKKYLENTQKLQEMGIPLNSSCCVPKDIILFSEKK